MRADVFPKFFTPYFGFGIFDKIHTFHDIGNLERPAVDIFTINDLGVIMGLGFPMGDYISAGLSARVFQRTGIDATLTANELLALVQVSDPTQFTNTAFEFLKTLLRTGYAYGINAGVLLRVPLKTNSPRWQIGLAVEDLGDTTFRALAPPALAPVPVIATYSAGTSLTYTLNKFSVVNVCLDLRNLFEIIPTLKTTHFGIEYRHRYFGFRMGFNHGWPTYGASLEFPPHTRVHLTSYAVELGNGPLERQQRYYLLQAVIGMNPF
jgi:hypothetical protein